MAGELTELFLGKTPLEQRGMMMRVLKTIQLSFRQDGSRVTGSETKRRYQICEKTIRTLRREHGWAFVRIMDSLPVALRAELDGLPWKPEEGRGLWMPSS